MKCFVCSSEIDTMSSWGTETSLYFLAVHKRRDASTPRIGCDFKICRECQSKAMDIPEPLLEQKILEAFRDLITDNNMTGGFFGDERIAAAVLEIWDKASCEPEDTTPILRKHFGSIKDS